VEEKAGAIAVSQRIDALDALRGLAILAMVFSGTIRYKILPAWMYHAQEPPPIHEFNKTLAGLTWVDIVFPLFLFAMGAALPFALSRRIAQGWKTSRVILYIFKRGALLGAFAIILQHLRPFNIDPDPTSRTWVLAMVGFGLLCLMFGRLPLAKLGRYRLLITLLGWIAGAALAAKGFCSIAVIPF
jgi:predicted acyltransferase